MCGILGYVADGALVSAERWLVARDSLTHRGPDDAGAWEERDGAIRLASRRLAILDLSPAGHQPMVDDEAGLAIVHNGEIYNYLELRDDLEARGHRFHSHSDTEVILAAYQEWGKDCLSRLNGMFAFAIWDSKSETLFAARDRFGEKPFYYVSCPGAFVFASEMKALLAAGVARPTPNHRAIYRYLAFREVDQGAETLFDGILALPPAHALTYSRRTEETEIWRYWDLDPDARVTLESDAEYAGRFLELLSDSVRLRLRSDVPVGSSLSGGLDSSSLVCLVAREQAGGVRMTFSARFDDPRLDEGKYIALAIEKAGADDRMVTPNPALLPQEIERVTWHQEEPFFSTSIYAQWCVMRLAKEAGVTVLLDGQGGDETLAGYHTYFGPFLRGELRHRRWLSFARTLRAFLREQGPRALPVALFGLVPPRLRHPVRRLVRPLAIPSAYRRAWGTREGASQPRFCAALNQAQYETLTRTMLPALLRYADRNAAAFSREVRLPFLDHRLVEFLFAIPPEQRLRGTTTKFVLREGLRGVLPEEIRTRRDKLGLEPPEAAWMRGELRGWIDTLVRSPQFAGRPWIDAAAATRTWEEFLRGRDAWHPLIWRWVSLEIWARVFLDIEATSRACTERPAHAPGPSPREA